MCNPRASCMCSPRPPCCCYSPPCCCHRWHSLAKWAPPAAAPRRLHMSSNSCFRQASACCAYAKCWSTAAVGRSSITGRWTGVRAACQLPAVQGLAASPAADTNSLTRPLARRRIISRRLLACHMWAPGGSNALVVHCSPAKPPGVANPAHFHQKQAHPAAYSRLSGPRHTPVPGRLRLCCAGPPKCSRSAAASAGSAFSWISRSRRCAISWFRRPKPSVMS